LEEQNKDWLVKVFQAASAHFVDRALGSDPKLSPITDWEVEQLRKGEEAGLFDLDGSFINVGKDRQYSLFGLNREYLTQIAEYVRLIVEDGYHPDSVRFEYGLLDIVVFDDQRPSIGVEVKATEQKGDKLRSDMLRMLPDPDIPDNDRGNDPIRKIKCLLELKPQEFWIVTPSSSWKYRATYPHEGHLVLDEIT
jgi:hypothetical protein